VRATACIGGESLGLSSLRGRGLDFERMRKKLLIGDKIETLLELSNLSNYSFFLWMVEIGGLL
jgi:hypothetical protein